MAGILCLLLNVFFSPSPALALTYYWGQHPQNERLVFEFQSTSLPEFNIRRSGPQTLKLQLPKDIWAKESKPQPIDLSGSRLFEDVALSGNTFSIHMQTNRFGYISFPFREEDKIVLDAFFDPSGAKWKEEEKGQTAKEPEQKAPSNKTMSRKAKRENKTSSRQAGQKNKTEKKQKEKTVPSPKRQKKNKAGNTRQTPPHPYKIKSRIRHVGPNNATAINATPGKSPGSITYNASAPAGRQSKNASPKQKDNRTKIKANQTKKIKTTANQTTPSNRTTAANASQNASSNATKPDFEGMMTSIRAAIANGEYQTAYNSLKTIKDDPRLPEKFKEEVLYSYADVSFQLYKDNIQDHVQEILTAYNRATNYDPDSPRLPQALLNMGYANLKAGNVPEARGYFNLLRNNHPNNRNIPLTYYYWGDYLLKNKKYEKAANQFEHIIQDHPDHKIAKKAAVGLARSLKELEYYKQAQKIIDFIQQRWPRYYLDNPRFLMLSGFVAYKNDNYSEAADKYWAFKNLVPKAKDVDIAQTRIGDIYLRQGKKKAAKEIYQETVKEFPDKEGGLISSMRLAEEGIYDEPSISDMFTVFDRPYNQRPEKIYNRIIDNFPDSPLAPVAQLKLAMWKLFNGDNAAALEQVQNFLRKFPSSKLKDRALKVGKKAFSKLVAKQTPAKDFKRILDIWNKYPFLQKNQKELSPGTRLAVATAMWHNKDTQRALSTARSLLTANGEKVSKQNRNTLGLLLNIHLDRKNWEAITQLAEKAKDWDLPQKQKQQLDYAHALSLEKMGESQKALPIWRHLGSDIEMPGKERAFALFYLAKQAMRKKDFEDVYVYGQEALSLFLQQGKNKTKIKECLDLLIRVTRRTGRPKEALGWALEYGSYVDKDDEDWPSFKYTLGELYKENGSMKRWRSTLKELIKARPETRYARMANSDLDTQNLEKKAQEFISGS